MKTTLSLLALMSVFALSGCGDKPADAKAEDDTEVSATVSEPATPVVAGEVATEAAEEIAAAEPEVEIDAVIEFKGEDGKLGLERTSLEMISPVHDAASDTWSVFVQLDEEAATAFYDLTTKTTGEALTIMVDDKIVATPVLETAVYGGGFVFNVENGKAADMVVATLKGVEPSTSVVSELAPADGAEPSDEPETTAVTTQTPAEDAEVAAEADIEEDDTGIE